jgi:hypothetical protein
MIIEWLLGRRRIEVEVAMDIEQTGESFHAHAIPQGIEIRPGDVVLVHGAPESVPFGTRTTYMTRATVIRGGWLDRHWTPIVALLELPELYEVGFMPKECSP